MANPIIKIKRGSGVPTSTGITAGEFAFNKTGNILYIGACGGYTGYEYGTISLGTAVASNDLNIIPIGMQISNDIEMGAGAELDVRAGFSNFTVPTTRAVREWVNQTKLNQVLGATFRAGPGIGVTTGQVGNSYDITISNTGVIKGFTGFSVTGNFHLSSDLVKAKSAIDGITFIGGGGIQLRGTNSQTSLEIQNIGVTSIGGFTGTINSITPIVSLSGFTSGIGLAVRQAVSGTSPIAVTTANVTGTEGNIISGINITHDTTITSANLKAYQDGTNIPQLINLGFNAYGHITSASSAALDFTTGLPIGFTEATQDAAYSGITNFYGNNNYGIDYVYDDGLGLLKTINRGITSLSAFGQVGLSGAVVLAVGGGPGNPAIPQLSVVQTKNNNTITYDYIGVQYKSFALKKPSVLGYPATEIYVGGVTGAGVGTLTAGNAISTLNVLPGRGIGISMGVQGGSDTMFIWNAGINTISARDTNGILLGDSGFSGNFSIQEGTNVQFTRTANLLTISSSGGGAGGAISALVATYNTAIPPALNGGSGVTGNIKIKGQDGVITRQETGVDTKDGDVYIGLSSKVKIPAAITTDDYTEANYQTLEIATRRENGGSPILPVVGSVGQEYFQTPVEYSKLITDIVEGGFTAAFTYGGGAYAKFSPQLDGEVGSGNFFNADKSYPGRILSLRAREGIWKVGDGPAATISGTHAELRLLGYPNPENMSAYIQGVFDFPSPSNGAGCPNNNCYGMPPILPSCNTGLVDQQEVYYHTDGAGLRNTDSAATGQQRGTAVFHSNIVAKDSIFVNKDIWLTGELIDATTGCLYGVSGGGGSNVFNGGNLGLTGDLIVQGSIYVHGTTAFFNVADLSTESPLIKIGGLSASNGTEQMQGINGTIGNRFGDRGLLLFSWNTIPYSPLFNTNSRLVAPITNFIGIDQDDGVFKYFIDATTSSFGSGNGNEKYSVINSGRLGPAKFSEINNVGITSDNTTISLRTGSATVVTKVELSGYAAITASTSSGNKADITLGNSAKVSFGSGGAGAVIDFPRGITFYPNTNNTDFEGGTAFNGGQALVTNSQNNLRIRYAANNLDPRTISIRNPGVNKFAQLVDNGKWASSDSSTLSTSGTIDADRQMIYNKTLADGTIIDCGTY